MSSEKLSTVYKASVKVRGRTFVGGGSTTVEALSSLKPGNVGRGVVILTVEREGTRRERILGDFQSRRLFSPSSSVREASIRNTALMFDGL